MLLTGTVSSFLCFTASFCPLFFFFFFFFLQLYVILFLQFYRLWSQLHKEKKNVKIDCGVSFMFFFFSINLIFLLNKICISLSLTNGTRCLLIFTYIKSSTRTSDKSAWPVYPRHMEQYMWNISIELRLDHFCSFFSIKLSYSGKIK